ncbi:MAG: chromosome segregation protein SMC [Ignavibacteriaceae bacterium]|nr:chromosome segregation protein SMC [Ignavibacteriaceae bacterium]
MYLSKLEILGFKSFANRTSISFNEGVTAVVGPNGCGKTNIVDAIRWCLGEQRSGTLRSDKMENVIFNGTSNKKPMGMAEVSMTIHNTKGILPTDYSEVTITRRIFRSGESEYLLNKNICRLKDITNLFMDTGIGANAYSVIELKMVETILSNKADERRIMFEEAAGVNKYKLRRRLALKKLDEVKNDLTRVNDIVTEVEKKVNSLERQAKKADKYNKVSATLRELELDLAEREFALFHLQIELVKNQKEEFFRQKLSIESEIAAIEDEIKAIKQKLQTIEDTLSSKRSEIKNQTERIFNLRRLISVTEERSNSLDKNIIRFRADVEELSNQIVETRKTLESNRLNVSTLEEKIKESSLLKNEKETEISRMSLVLENKKSGLKATSDLLLQQFKEIHNKENDLSNLTASIEQRNLSIQKLNDKIQLLTGNIAKTVGFIESLSEEKTEISRNLAEAESEYFAKQREKDNLEKSLAHLKETEINEKTSLQSLKEKINFLQNLLENLEGISKGAKILFDDTSWTSGEKKLLAHLGNSVEEYRYALDAALKSNLNSLLINSRNDLEKAIDILKSTESGKTSFILLENNFPSKTAVGDLITDFFWKRKAKKLSKEKSFIGWASDFIETDSKWKLYFNRLLRNCAVVDTIENALILQKTFPEFNFVTLHGDMINNSGVIVAGSIPKPDDTVFGRTQALERMREELSGKEKKLTDLKNEIEVVEEKINDIDLKVLSDKGRLIMNDLSNVEKQLAQFEYEKQKLADEVELARVQIQELASESNILDNQKNSLEDVLLKLKDGREKTETEKSRLEEDTINSEKEYTGLQNSFNELALSLERLSGEKRNLENSNELSLELIENFNRSIKKRNDEIDESENEKKQIARDLIERNLELQQLEDARKLLTAEEEIIEKDYKLVRSEIDNKEKAQQELRKRREEILEQTHAIDIKLNELDIKMENLKENISEAYSVTLEKKIFDDLDSFDFEKRIAEVHNYKQQIKNLGPINILAYSEYEEELERFNFLSRQRNDLIESEKDIVRTIEEINSTAQSLFMETFEKIRSNFIDIFRMLFNPGDEADLRLEENVDPLEGKIEIVAKPKGKRPTSIELLSGGEKTLTAIALLFAIYLVKPSPFCILDEIDAPLDDANIDRFTRIIKDFSKSTQFIIVTHNKRTMEAAQTLYGVTMQEEGVSKLVSVRFNEEFNYAG